jgi:hypothetical protein
MATSGHIAGNSIAITGNVASDRLGTSKFIGFS